MTNHLPVHLRAAVFDMDGLLLDTEPLWEKSMAKITEKYQIPVAPKFFKLTTGLRIYEVTEFWKVHFLWPNELSPQIVADAILDDIISEAKNKGRVMPGAKNCIHFLKQKGLKIGLATSSPMRMVQELIPLFGLSDSFDTLISADTVKFGKPHPDVFLRCAESLGIPPWACFVLEDSLSGMIAAKAARMKVVVVPEPAQFDNPQFALADVRLHSLTDFGEQIWESFS